MSLGERGGSALPEAQGTVLCIIYTTTSQGYIISKELYKGSYKTCSNKKSEQFNEMKHDKASIFFY